jgi:hypothetical protein
VSTPDPDPIGEHLAALAAALRGPARAKARMLTEAHGGLLDAAAGLAGSAGTDDDAARGAVRQFGTVAEVAPAFQQELTVLQARRTAAAVAVTVPALMACWHLVTAVTALTLTTASLLAGNWPLGVLVGAVTIASHTRLAASARTCRACARVTAPERRVPA